MVNMRNWLESSLSKNFRPVDVNHTERDGVDVHEIEEETFGRSFRRGRETRAEQPNEERPVDVTCWRRLTAIEESPSAP